MTSFDICIRKSERVNIIRGIGALSRSDRKRIKFNDERYIQCSIDLDADLQERYPNDSRWDYALLASGIAIFIEVHDASASSAIDEIRRKANWLLDLVRRVRYTQAKRIVWVASGKTRVRPDDHSFKALAKLGVVFAGSNYWGDR